MTKKGCSGLDISNYYSLSERKHSNHCLSKKSSLDCIRPEGCIWDDSDEKCKLNVADTLGSAYINGGFGFGKLCLDRELTRLILMFLFPPLYVFLSERDRGFVNKREIILNLIYTSLFYIPGLIHALQYKHTRNN